MLFDQIINAVSADKDITIDGTWTQGRTLLGGLSAAILYQLMRKQTANERQIKNLNVRFVRPLMANEPFRLECQALASGRTATIQSAQIIQQDKIRVSAQADFISVIPSTVRVEEFTAPQIAAITASNSRAMQGQEVPAFIQHFNNYLTAGGLPFHGHNNPDQGGWMAFKQTSAKLSIAHLICLIDTWAPAASSYYQQAVPLSTISWDLHFANPVDDIAGDQHLGYLNKLNYADSGVSSSNAVIWGPQGQLLAHSYQTNIIYG